MAVPGQVPNPESPTAVLELLQHGTLSLKGLLPYSSNYIFLGTVQDEDHAVPCVYKPRDGENPLGDFPYGTLCQREVAAWYLAEALGWPLVPPTLLRDGEHGPGSVQLFIPHDPAIHYFNFRYSARHTTTLRQLALFDYLANNADRKSGHCLIDDGARLWAIDHGICFHHHYKLRTVIWEFAGEPIEAELWTGLTRCTTILENAWHACSQALATLLAPSEREALLQRLQHLHQTQQYPLPRQDRRNFPWPPI